VGSGFKITEGWFAGAELWDEAGEQQASTERVTARRLERSLRFELLKATLQSIHQPLARCEPYLCIPARYSGTLVRQRRSSSGLPWIGVAAAALLLGHWAAYVLTYRQLQLRDAVLAQTGHSYLAWAGKLTFVILFLAVAWLVTEACRSSQADAERRFLPVAARLMGIQIVGFSALEVIERMMVRAPVMEMFAHYTYALGILMQVITALAGAVIVLLLTRTARQIYLLVKARGRTRRPRVRSGRVHPRPWVARHRDLVGATGVRGPP
jgi:hypothetical protein